MSRDLWQVEVETRLQGAIGVYRLSTFEITAPDSETATIYALQDAHSEGLETRVALAPRRVP